MTDEQKRDFLLAVVNGKEQVQERRFSIHDRADFIQDYRDWFPPYDPADPAQLKAHEEHYRRVRAEWCLLRRQFPVEKSDETFGLKVACLRQMLRVLWVNSNESKRKQDLMLSRIAIPIGGMERQPPEQWRTLQLDALRWLHDRLEKLRVCQNPLCTTRHTYFLQDCNHYKYCCPTCVGIGERERENSERKGPIKPVSKETIERMKESARKRWDRERQKRLFPPDEIE